MSCSTDIKTLDGLSDIQITREDLPHDIFDFTQSIDSFLMAINFYVSTNNENDIEEAICRIVNMYSMSESSIVKKYILKICTDSNLSFDSRISLACNLCQITANEETYKILSELCSRISESTLLMLLKVDILIILFRSDSFSDIAVKELLKILQDQTQASKFRYNIITSLSIKLDEWKTGMRFDEITFDDDAISKKFSSLQLDFFEIFLKDETNLLSFRILAGQQCCMANPTPEIQTYLLSIASNPDVKYNERADVADVLLRYGTDEYKMKAKKIILMLGGSDNVYKNAQNAHDEFIESSALEILRQLIDLYPIIETLNFTKSKEYILSNTFNPDKLTKVFERIEFDRALYLSMTLSQILVLVVSYMLQFGHGLKRLVTELEDCDEICSTGIMERILNSLSGYDTFLIRISYEDQIKNNFIGRLNAKIKSLDTDICMHHEFCKYIHTNCDHICGCGCTWNDDFKANILWELTISSSEIAKRQNLLTFYRKYQVSIISELKEEFCPFVDDQAFDMYIRTAMIAYD